MPIPDPLPIDPLLPDIRARLRAGSSLVLSAPPGAGKTTRVPPALLDELAAGQVLVLQPRRIAARAAARRVAAERGIPLGREVGFRVRGQAAVGPDTRLIFVTEGVLLRRLQQDPLLEGVAAVLLDEVHERHLETDLALSFLREVQQAREELRLVCMSATLEAGPLSAFLGDAPVIEAPGRAFPVDVRFLPAPDDRPPAVQAVAGVRRALHDQDDDGGDLLVFLPGAADIRAAAEALGSTAGEHGLVVLPLHGEMPDADQDRVFQRAERRKVVLATNVAESSLTVPGVTTVVDTGWVKRVEQDPRTGLERLRRVRISRAAARQRAGRAGRTAPGRAFRCWTAGEHHALAERDRPAIGREDLTGLVLQVRGWGCAHPATFGWLEPPPAAALERADALLTRLGALHGGGLTAVGRLLLGLPLPPRLARVLVAAADLGAPEAGAWLAALASERDVLQAARAFRADAHDTDAVGGSDLVHRWERLQAAEAQGGGAGALRRQGLDPGAVRAVRATAKRLLREARRLPAPDRPAARTDGDLATVLLAGFPDRVAVRRPDARDRYQLYTGRPAVLDPRSVVRDAPLLIAHDVADGPRGGQARILRATEITEAQLAQIVGERLVEQQELRFDGDAERVVAERVRRYDDLILARLPAPVTDRDRGGEVLAAAAARDPHAALRPDADAAALLARLRFLAEALPEEDLPRFDDAALGRLVRDLSIGRLSFAELRQTPLQDHLRARLGHGHLRLLEREAPERLEVPSGSRIRLQYSDHGPPVLAVKLQEVFGWRETPRLARGRVPVLLHLLAPNGRPAQVTRDLESFWRSGYAEVRKELRGRYPKHPWPEDPLTATPTGRTRPRRRR